MISYLRNLQSVLIGNLRDIWSFRKRRSNVDPLPVSSSWSTLILRRLCLIFELLHVQPAFCLNWNSLGIWSLERRSNTDESSTGFFFLFGGSGFVAYMWRALNWATCSLSCEVFGPGPSTELLPYIFAEMVCDVTSLSVCLFPRSVVVRRISSHGGSEHRIHFGLPCADYVILRVGSRVLHLPWWCFSVPV